MYFEGECRVLIRNQMLATTELKLTNHCEMWQRNLTNIWQRVDWGVVLLSIKIKIWWFDPWSNNENPPRLLWRQQPIINQLSSSDLNLWNEDNVVVGIKINVETWLKLKYLTSSGLIRQILLILSCSQYLILKMIDLDQSQLSITVMWLVFWPITAQKRGCFNDWSQSGDASHTDDCSDGC